MEWPYILKMMFRIVFLIHPYSQYKLLELKNLIVESIMIMLTSLPSHDKAARTTFATWLMDQVVYLCITKFYERMAIRLLTKLA